MDEYLTIIREFETKKRSLTSVYDLDFSSKLSVYFNEKFSYAVKMQKVQSSYLKDKVFIKKERQIEIVPKFNVEFFQRITR